MNSTSLLIVLYLFHSILLLKFPAQYNKNLHFLKSGKMGYCILGKLLLAIYHRLSRFLKRFLEKEIPLLITRKIH